MIGVVLVTGASGALGSRLLPALAEAGWHTRALLHRAPAPGAAEIVRGDLEDASSLSAAAQGADAILHLAARTHARRAREYRRANVGGTANLLRAAAAAGARRFVHVSTRAISPHGGSYSRSKLEAEALVRDAAIEHVIVRLPEVYGAGGREGVDDMLARAGRGVAIALPGSGDDMLCPVHVDDAVHALVAALTAPVAAGRTYTLAGECHSAREVANACVRACGGNGRIVPIPLAALTVAGWASRVLPLPLYPDQLARLRAEKPAPSPEAASDLGFNPRPLDRGLADALGVARPV